MPWFAQYRSDDFSILKEVEISDQGSAALKIMHGKKVLHKIPGAATLGWECHRYLRADGKHIHEWFKTWTQPDGFRRGGMDHILDDEPPAARKCKNYAKGEGLANASKLAPDWLQQKFKAIERTFPKRDTASDRLNRLVSSRKAPTISK